MGSTLFDLTGRTAVVVGGTSGIGRMLALGLADAGADVVATARRQPLVDEMAREIEARGRRTLRATSDVGDRGSLDALRDAVLKALGRVDIVVCAAGITKRVPRHAFRNGGSTRRGVAAGSALPARTSSTRCGRGSARSRA